MIGNPPYVRQEGLGDFKPYFERRFSVYNGAADLYVYFIEKGVSLLREGGLFAYIVANKWLRANYGNPLRQWMQKQRIVEIIDFGDLPVFTQATTYPCIIVIQKKAPAPTFPSIIVETLEFNDLEEYVAGHRHDVRQDALDPAGWSLANQNTQDLLDKLRKIGVPLGQYVHGQIYYGIKTGLNEAFVIDEATRIRLIAEDPRSAEVIKPFLAGRDIKRYKPASSEKYVLFTRHGVNIDRYAAVKNYLAQFKTQLMPRPRDWKGDKWPGRKPGAYQWYEIQDAVDYYAVFEKPKIIVPAIVKTASYAFDADGFYSNDKTTIIPTTDKYLLGLIGSTTLDYFMHSIASTKQGGYFEYKPMYLSKLPIRTINFDDPADVARHDRMVGLVEQMLALHKKLAESRIPQTSEMLKRQIEATDRQIDQLAYQLYDLTAEEIKIVESAT